jgi:4-alpha-glucanotransferase
MRATLHLIFVMHEPVGTRHERMREIAESAYVPLIDLLEAFDDDIRCGLHCSGWVLEWLDRHWRALSDRIAALASSGTVEMLGGGFYAPLLPIVPWRDGCGQLEMAAGYLERRMGVRPSGVWLTDGVWEPRMAELLADAGATWTLVDESVLHDAGVAKPIGGHYVTEHLGRPVIVLPVDEKLASTLPYAPPAKSLTRLKKRTKKLGANAVLTWCGSPKVFADDQLANLFAQLAAASKWLRVRHPSTTIEKGRPRGAVYMRPTGCLGRPLAQQQFLRYAEASWMHKRMIEVSKRFAALERVMRNEGYKGLSKLTHPRRALFRGQSATVYEQGGTIYRPEVRDGVYRNLIDCESQTNSMIRGDAPFLETSIRDLFGDFETSVLLRNPTIRLVIQPYAGGALAAFEHTPSRTALHNVITRRPEPWHSGADYPKPPPYDGHTRSSLLDRFLLPGGDVDGWMSDSAELGDLMSTRYRMVGVDQVGHGSDERVVVSMTADGHVSFGDRSLAVSVIKRVGLGAQDSHASIDYQIEFAEPLPSAVDFCCELNWATLHWLGDVSFEVDTIAEAASDLRAIGRSACRRTVAMRHDGLGLWVVLQSEQQIDVERAPIITCDPAPDGIKETLQGVALMLRHSMQAGDTQLNWAMRLGVTPLSEAPDAAT